LQNKREERNRKVPSLTEISLSEIELIVNDNHSIFFSVKIQAILWD